MLVSKSIGYTSILLLHVLFASSLLSGAEESDLLKYSASAKPGSLTVDRMPSPAPRSYKQEFSYTVTNPTRTDFNGTAPSCQTFDVEVFFVSATGETSVWKWSSGQKFCQHVTKVQIPAGQMWTQKVTWTFTTNQVQDGKYRVVATFVPTGNKSAVADFEITSVELSEKKLVPSHTEIVNASVDSNGNIHPGVAPIRQNGRITCLSAHGHDELHYPPACYITTTSAGSQILKPGQAMGTGAGGTMNLYCNGQAPERCSARIND